MSLLLDTHAFLWTLFAPENLSKKAARAVEKPGSEVSVSVVTFWEISLKYGLGKIELAGVGPEDLPAAAEQANLAILEMSPDEASSFHRLPRGKHKDPFDRLLVWQALQRDLILVSKDGSMDLYAGLGLKRLW
ncbi:MAG: type II toxin-antitoxin system VapC family toxin [Desulfobacteraceae bacterium]